MKDILLVHFETVVHTHILSFTRLCMPGLFVQFYQNGGALNNCHTNGMTA